MPCQLLCAYVHTNFACTCLMAKIGIGFVRVRGVRSLNTHEWELKCITLILFIMKHEWRYESGGRALDERHFHISRHLAYQMAVQKHLRVLEPTRTWLSVTWLIGVFYFSMKNTRHTNHFIPLPWLMHSKRTHAYTNTRNCWIFVESKVAACVPLQ